MKEPKIRLSFASIVAVSIIIGFVAGVVGELWINQYLAPEIQFKDYRDLTKRLDDLSTQQKKELKDLLAEQDFSVSKIVEQIQPTVVRFYPEKEQTNILNSSYLDQEMLGAGFILTSDGWLLTSKKVVADAEGKYAARINGSTYPVEKMVADTMTDVVFVKIGAENLPVVEFGAKNQLHFSQSVLVADLTNGVVRTSIDDLFYSQIAERSDLIHSSEEYYRGVLLRDDFAQASLGSPVFDLNGRVVGMIVDESGVVVPVDFFSAVLKTATKDNVIERALLGVNYVDLEQVSNITLEQKIGALIQGDSDSRAVVSNSPADQAGIKTGDIVIKVENEEVNKFHSLSELIQDYKIDDKVTLTILRDGEIQELELTLSAQ